MNFIKRGFIALFMLFPLGALCQNDPVVWNFKAARVNETQFIFIIEAYMKRGWELYSPNNEKCLLSPAVTFDIRAGIEPLGGVEVMEGVKCDTGTGFCTVPRYKTYVIFGQTFQMPSSMSQIVSGTVEYQPVNDGYAPSPLKYSFSLRVGDTTGMISADSVLKQMPWCRKDGSTLYINMAAYKKKTYHYYPSGERSYGLFKRIWVWIRHPYF